MKNEHPMPLGAACTTLMPAELRLLHDAGARLGGVAGTAIQLATIMPWTVPNLELAQLSDVDFDTGVVRTLSIHGEDAEVVLGRHALSIVAATANGNRTGSMLAGGVETSVHLAKDPMHKAMLDAQLAAIDDRTASIRWDFATLRLSVAQRMQLDGVPYSILLAQTATVQAQPPGPDRDRLIERQRAAADTVAASLQLFTRPSRPAFYRPVRDLPFKAPLTIVTMDAGGGR